MYQMLRGRSLKALSTEALPPLVAALVLAEIFYKWHSFSLECLGFLATWFVLDRHGRRHSSAFAAAARDPIAQLGIPRPLQPSDEATKACAQPRSLAHIEFGRRK